VISCGLRSVGVVPTKSWVIENRMRIQSPAEPDSLAVYARVAGSAYLVIIAAGIYAEFFVRGSLVVPGDAAATAGNIARSELFFRSGLASEFIMLLCDVLVATMLYVVFEPASRSLSLLAAFLRLAHAAVVGGNLLNTYIPLLLLGDAGHMSGLGTGQLQTLALVFLQAHSFGYVIGLMFFGFQCLVLGYLVFTSRMVPRILGILLVCAGVGYLVDGFARTLLVRYSEYETAFALIVFAPAFIGELSFGLWLLTKGVRLPTIERRDPESGQ
jgi:hypothetical protein